MQGKDVSLDAMKVTYPNGFTAVHPTNLTVGAGEFFSILGPSGCGKTTILRTVSGFVAPSSGRVRIGGQDMAGRGPNDRPTALIFQNLALFPLMSVRDNVAFGLEARGMSRRDRHARAEELLHLVALGDQADKMPGALSGGQRQRVAIARALAVEPAVLLLDEPLSALDLKLRSHMRAELRAIQKKTGVTFIYITHDQGEALTMSDRVAVMNKGRIEQVGTGDQIYSNPKTAFAASFVGEANRLFGRVLRADNGHAVIRTDSGDFRARNPSQLAEGAEAILFIRPEAMKIGEGVNSLPAELLRRDLEGAFVTLHFRTQAQDMSLHQTNTGAPLPEGPVHLRFDVEDGFILGQAECAETAPDMAAQ